MDFDKYKSGPGIPYPYAVLISKVDGENIECYIEHLVPWASDVNGWHKSKLTKADLEKHVNHHLTLKYKCSDPDRWYEERIKTPANEFPLPDLFVKV
jgi:hypothetical protein